VRIRLRIAHWVGRDVPAEPIPGTVHRRWLIGTIRPTFFKQALRVESGASGAHDRSSWAGEPVASRFRESGILLVECLVYMAVWSVVVGLALATFYRAWDNSRSLARYTEDMARALKAGERWRAEIRQATGPLKLVEEAGVADQALHIPQAGGEIVYFCTGTNLLRRVGEEGSWTVLLPAMKTSRMLLDTRGSVTSWRWELELASSPKRQTRIRPLFTFQAVPGTKTEP